MSFWSSRLLTPESGINQSSHSDRSSADSTHRPLTTGHRRRPSQLTESDILQNTNNIPILASPQSQSYQPTETRIRRPSMHGRSSSHPFVSRMPGADDIAGPNIRMGNETVASDAGYNQSQPSLKLAPNKTSPNVERDLMTGKCMTCDSLVRWPKELKVFRCTVCLTINDLTPISLHQSRSTEAASLGDKTAESGLKNPAVKVEPISLQKTKDLINDCIRVFLQSQLHHDLPFCDSENRCRADREGWYGDEGNGDANNRPFRHKHSLSQSQSPTREAPDICSTSRRSQLMVSSCSERQASGREDSMNASNDFSTTSVPQISLSPANGTSAPREPCSVHVDEKGIFKPLEEYMISSFQSQRALNASFSSQPSIQVRSEGSEEAIVIQPCEMDGKRPLSTEMIYPMDEKTLLIGDFAENGSWWTGRHKPRRPSKISRAHRSGGAWDRPHLSGGSVTSKSPLIDWREVDEWYDLLCHPGRTLEQTMGELTMSESDGFKPPSAEEMKNIRCLFLDAETHIKRVLLKSTESLLKRPGGVLKEPSDVRFLLIILANPILYASSSSARGRTGTRPTPKGPSALNSQGQRRSPGKASHLKERIDDRSGPGRHSGIVKRVVGLLSNLSNECHHHLVAWFARLPEQRFRKIAELLGGFVTYRLTRQHGRRRNEDKNVADDLVPHMSSTGHTSSAALHAALDGRTSTKSTDGRPKPVVYNDDWQLKAAARVMALVFAANNSFASRPKKDLTQFEGTSHSALMAGRARAHRCRQVLATSDFYNTLLDYSDLIADFEAWESKRGKFAFCQYPFFLSIWAKIQIMEHDARRQMEVKAREAFFDSIMTRKSVNQYLILKVRRECLVEDSLKGVSEVVGSGSEEIKKGLRIEFKGEEGIDAGGLRKEWFLLLVRDVFNPDHGMFAYDDESQACYFNPNSFETSDQFFLVGVVLGLAIYNSTILDVALPSFAFRKLLAASPAASAGKPTHAKQAMVYTLDDLAEYRPSLANGLQQLLDFEGDVEETYCRDFVADVERFGQIQQVPLCPGGENKAVTNSNREEFVDLYVKYLLDTAVIRQFEPFKRGFFTVCGGNALSLFRPEEIELLIRGSDEPLDIDSLQAVAVYDNWGVPNPARTEPVTQWFWRSFKSATPKDQRKLLSFITGSDRIPAMGAANLVIKLSCLGDDCMRFPVARTCFNMLSLWRYSSMEKLERMLWRAVNESEGFGLK